MRTLLILTLAATAAACSTPTANIAGTYSTSIVQGTDGCKVATTIEGTMTTDSTLTITQTGDDVIAASGPSGASLPTSLMALVGIGTFTGNIDGNSLQLTINGEFTRMINGCNYRLDAVITASASGSTLNGALDYRAVSDDPTCSTMTDAGSAISGATGCDTADQLTATKQ